MACFLACFGFSKKPKRRKISSKVLSVDRVNSFSQIKKRNRRKYEPLDSEPIKITTRSIMPDPESRDTPKEQSSTRIKKKVSFNLNVTAYEPLSKSPQTDEETEEEMALHFAGDISMKGSYPSNHRYQNFSYDEDEDDMELEESDLDDDDDIDDLNDLDEEHDFHYNGDDQYPKEAEFSGQLNYLSQFAQHKTDLEKNCNARHRSQYVCSVLNPVENLSQWKAIKTNDKSVVKNRKKENVPLPQEQQIYSSLKPSWDTIPLISAPNSESPKSLMEETPVDASLSNWASPQQITAAPSWPVEQRKICRGKSNLYNTICELDERLMYKGRAKREVEEDVQAQFYQEVAHFI